VERAERLLAALAVLQARRRVTADELAGELGVSRRTVLRDVQALARAEVPVFTERGRYGGIVLLPGSQVDAGRLSESQAQVLQIFGLDTRRAAELGLTEAVRGAARTLAARRRAPTAGSSPPLALSEVVAVDSGGWFVPDETVDVAALAADLRTGRRLRITYRHSGERSAAERTVDPYGLYARSGRWYLIADHRGRPRMFALARLTAWTVLGTARALSGPASPAEVAADLVRRLEESHPVTISALLDTDRIDLARRILGRRLIRVAETDDPDTVHITVGYETLDGVRHLLQFSDHLEVIGPPEARARVAALAEDLLRRHRRSPTSRSVRLPPESGDDGPTPEVPPH